MDPHEHHHQHDEHHHFIDPPAPPPLGPAGLDNYSTDIYHPIPIQQEPIIEHEPYRPPRLSRDEIYALQVSEGKLGFWDCARRRVFRFVWDAGSCLPARIACRLSAMSPHTSDNWILAPFQWEENYLKLEGVFVLICLTLIRLTDNLSQILKRRMATATSSKTRVPWAFGSVTFAPCGKRGSCRRSASDALTPSNSTGWLRNAAHGTNGTWS